MQWILVRDRREPLAPSTRKTCWVGIDLFSPSRAGGLVRAGRACTALAELQMVVGQIKDRVDTIVREASAAGLA